MLRLPVLWLAPLVAAIGCGGGSNKGACNDAPGSICTLAGNGQSALHGNGGPATEASLYTPQDTAVAPDGSVWVLDFNDYLVRAINDKGIIDTVVGTGLLGDSPRDQGEPQCPALEAKFNHTPNLLFDGNYLYLAAWHNSDVKRVVLDTMMVEDFVGISKRTLYTGDEGPAIQAAVDLPSSVAKAPNGDIVIMDQANQVIRNVDSNGVIHRMAGICIADNAGYGGADCSGTAIPGTLDTTLHACPGIDTKPNDPTTTVPNDKMTHCVDSTGAVLAGACAWPCTPLESGDGGPALQLRMNQPFGQSADPAGRIAYDKAGNLFFVDTAANRIRKIDTNGMVSTVAGVGGAEGYSGDGGPATQAQLAHPVDVAVADDDTLYFTDVHNNCVRKIDPSGTISSFAGDCTTAGQCGDATGDCFSQDVNVQASCDTSSTACFAGDGGPATQARLNRPYGLDLNGNKLYISDSYNNRVRVVTLK